MSFPQRVVCLTAETPEIIDRLGAFERVVGVSGYAVRPPGVRKLPRVGAFTTVDVDKVESLRPDLVITYSDLQADAAAELVRRGLTVLALNHHTLGGIIVAIRLIGGALGLAEAAERLVNDVQQRLDSARLEGRRLPRRPRVFFEEWPDPLIFGTAWVSELIEIAGGQDVFADADAADAANPTPGRHLARNRIVDAAKVSRRGPEIVLASWCGKKVVINRILQRPGWSDVAAVRSGHVYEIKSADILQPGLAVLRGLEQMQRIFAEWAAR